jgi:ketosteroid isomerase-like protein
VCLLRTVSVRAGSREALTGDSRGSPVCESRLYVRKPGYWAAMSQENVEVIKRAHERLFGDLAAFRGAAADLAEFCHPEVHVDQTRRVLNPASYDGYEGLIRAFTEVRDAWEQFALEPEQFIDAGDRVVVVHRVRARGRGSGVEIVDRSASLYTLRDGRVVRLVIYGEPSEALEAVGLRSGGHSDHDSPR